MNNLANNFPFTKDDFGNLCATVDLLILNVCKNASKQYSQTQVMKILQGYQSLKYPLMAIWESYGFGDISEISTEITSPIYYQAFKVDTINTLQDIINGVYTLYLIRQNTPHFHSDLIEFSRRSLNIVLFQRNHRFFEL